MIVTSFVTNEFYRNHAAGMEASARAVGLSVEIHEKPKEESYSQALMYKPYVILETLEAHPDQDALYVDADVRFLKPPVLVLEPGDCDAAWGWLRPRQPHGCVLFFRNTVRARVLIKLWMEMFSRHPHVHLDEIHLYYAYRELKGMFRFRELPPAYGWMDGMKRRFPGADPVIFHLGAGIGSDKAKTLREYDEFLA